MFRVEWNMNALIMSAFSGGSYEILSFATDSCHGLCSTAMMTENIILINPSLH